MLLPNPNFSFRGLNTWKKEIRDMRVDVNVKELKPT